jgi:hypothetical protein
MEALQSPLVEEQFSIAIAEQPIVMGLPFRPNSNRRELPFAVGSRPSRLFSGSYDHHSKSAQM